MKNTLFILTLAALMNSCSLSSNQTQPIVEQDASPVIQSSETTPTVVPVKDVPVDTASIPTPKSIPVPTPAPAPEQAPIPVPTPTPEPSGYTLSDVQKHSTSSDCWMVLSSGVYDVTSYISRHPGGNQITRGCGKDATQMFAKHPESAKAIKEQFKIGDLVQ